jgi:hypothetical protein
MVVGLMIAGAGAGWAAGTRVAVGAGRAAGTVGLGAGVGSRLVPLEDGVAAARPGDVVAGVARLAAPPRWVSPGRAAGTGVGELFPSKPGWSVMGEPRRMIASMVRSGVGWGA